MKNKYNTSTSMLDLLFLSLAAFVALFIISFVQIQEKNPAKKNTEAKAEFIITYEWDKDKNCDVDAYVEDPNGDIVFFRKREGGLIHLDRDDLGNNTDRITLPDGTVVEFAENREVVTLRKTMAGEYVFNAHMYAKRDVEGDVVVKIKAEKINPFSVVAVSEVVLTQTADEKTAFRFSIDSEGNVTAVNNLEKKLATQQLADSVEDEDYENEFNEPDPSN